MIDDFLAALAAARPTWMADALCQEYGPKLFFPDGLSGRNATIRFDKAVAVCARCMVRDECLDYALEHKIVYGVWGGMSERHRRVVARQRQDAATPNPEPLERLEHEQRRGWEGVSPVPTHPFMQLLEALAPLMEEAS